MLDSDTSTRESLALLAVAERDPLCLDRRRFLQLVAMGLGAGLVSGPGSTLLDVLDLGSAGSAWAAPAGGSDGVLVVLSMHGGNDGLNTVVPISDGAYYTQRGGLAIPASQTLPLGPGRGLNTNLPELKRWWDAGQMAIVEGVGYPSPDLSHFNSIAYWMAGRPGGTPTTGWIGRWLDGLLGGTQDLYAAAEVGFSLPLQLVGEHQRGTAVPVGPAEFGSSVHPRNQRVYRTIRSMRSRDLGQWYDAVSQAFSDQLDLAANIAPAYPVAPPDSGIVSRMEAIARLINANLGFRVLTAGWNDFDSHAGQPAMHTARMGDLNAAIKRFFDTLDPAWRSRVTLMTTSEFGRTSWANDAVGTDHGTAAPHFVIGQNVRGGFYGQAPSIAGLGRWDRMAHTVDFRSYYASVIDGWLGGGSSTVLGGSFENLDLFARGPGLNADGSFSPGPATVSPPSTLIPVAPFRLLDTRDGTGGLLNRPLEAGEAVRVPILGRGAIPAAGVTGVVANVTAVDATTPNFFTVYPGSTIRPLTSNLNAGPGRPVPNLVIMGVGPDGCVDVYNSHGRAHCLVDVFGYFTPSAGDGFVPISPTRLFDTRTGEGIRPGKVPSLTPIDVQVGGVANVPADGATAVVVNLTVTEPESPGWMRLTPTGQAAASTSNVNFAVGDTVPNLVVCKLGDGGRMTLDGFGTGAHVVADVFGYFRGAGGQRLRTLPPQRLLDTRIGVGAIQRRVGPNWSIALSVGGHARVPYEATAVVINVTATNVAGPSFVTVWPDGEPQPGTSNLNVIAGSTAANLVICRVGEGAALRFANPMADCDIVADVLGYFVD